MPTHCRGKYRVLHIHAADNAIHHYVKLDIAKDSKIVSKMGSYGFDQARMTPKPGASKTIRMPGIRAKSNWRLSRPTPILGWLFDDLAQVAELADALA